MKNYIAAVLLFVVMVVSACASKKTINVFPDFYEAIAQRGNSGRADGNRWVTFQVKLLNAPKGLLADTIWVNAIALPIELTHVGDTTYFNALYYGLAPGTEEPLVADKNYVGKARLNYAGKEEMLNISKFRIAEPMMFP